MRRPKRAPEGGFTLLEVMIALVILLLASLGVAAGLLAASRDLRAGQLTQYRALLADARVQRVRLADKAALIASASGTLAWVPDPLPAVAGDLGTGECYYIQPNGEIRTAAGSGVRCCREVAVTQGSSVGAPGAIAAGAMMATVWVRVTCDDRPWEQTVRSEVVVL